MREALFAGVLAILTVLLVPMGIVSWYGAGPAAFAAPSPVPSPSPAAVPQTESPRQIRAFVVHTAANPESFDASSQVTVSIGGTDQVMCLEDYLCGVLMGEMPASFPLEALKAQAVAARTYTLRRVEGGGVLSDDPAVCQAYYPLSRAAEKYGDSADAYVRKIRQAVQETDGQVMTYAGNLIAATYFSCSGGRTESAQDVWGSAVPYLVSVDSPGEESAGPYESTLDVPMAEFLDALEIEEPTLGPISFTAGGGVDTVSIGGRIFTGQELRTCFGLRSTWFSMTVEPDCVRFSVRGNGHRVGLSQYGAKAMAEAGHDYREILTWYYSGAQLGEAV